MLIISSMCNSLAVASDAIAYRLLAIRSKLWLWKTFFFAKYVHIFLFVVVNIIIGSLGVWMPLMLSTLLVKHSFGAELSAALAASGPYTFAVAYLAASTAYVAYEYLDNQQSPNRKIKTFLTASAFVLIILCTMLSAFQTQSTRHSGLADVVASENAPDNTSLSGVPVTEAGGEHGLTSTEELQLSLVFISIGVGLLLYVVTRWDDEDSKTMVSDHERQLDIDAARLTKKSRGDGAAYKDLKV